MHINVREFLVEDVGYHRSYRIAGERPSLDAVKLMADIEGGLTISRLEAELLVQANLSTAIELECHRCLRSFTRPVRLVFAQPYSKQPDDDQLPIEHSEINLDSAIEQEILVGLPIKIICQPDCEGVEGVDKRYTKEDAGPRRLGDTARITKGPQRGRTKETHDS